MIIKGLISEDFVNYKKPAMTIMFPHCNGFKCGAEYCQNSPLAQSNDIEISIQDIVERYLHNPITEAVVMQGLEPFDDFDALFEFIKYFRQYCDDEIVIFTGVYKDEITDEIRLLKQYKNIIIKYGRYIPNHEKHYDDVLGVYLISDNQYAEKIS